jgi:hypothetical protein
VAVLEPGHRAAAGNPLGAGASLPMTVLELHADKAWVAASTSRRFRAMLSPHRNIPEATRLVFVQHLAPRQHRSLPDASAWELRLPRSLIPTQPADLCWGRV